MKRFPKCKPNLWDGLVYLLILALAIASGAAVWGGTGNTGHLTAVVSIDGTENRRVDLTELDQEETVLIAAQDYELQLVLSPDGAEIIASDCPTQDCVHTGKITRVGQSIVCLPARVSVQLVGEQDANGVDAVIG